MRYINLHLTLALTFDIDEATLCILLLSRSVALVLDF